MNQQLKYMNRAYDLALKGWGRTLPNPMVGAVVVKAGKVVGEGWHAFCGGPHAEVAAFAQAGAKTRGADVYVTLEPCAHFGRTPPCTQAIIAAGIKRVFVGVEDPNSLMRGKSLKFLRKAGIAVEAGFLQEELTRLNEVFNKYITTRMPFVTAKIAQTIDGKIAALSGESKWITSQETRDYSRELRFGFDAILVGINTVLKDDPGLNAVPQKPIKKIILDTHLRLPPKAKLFHNSDPQNIFVFTAAKPKKNYDATIVQSPLRQGHVDLGWVMKYLGQREISSVLIEGGSQTIGSALAQGLVDKMMVYIAPKILGEGLESVRGLKTKKLSQAINLKNISAGRIGEDILLEGYL